MSTTCCPESGVQELDVQEHCVRGHSVRFAAGRHDHMIGQPCLRSQGPITREPQSAAFEMLRQMLAQVKLLRG
jgi:UDP-2,3-diacylglucosamine pyrophosphatase LpxH